MEKSYKAMKFDICVSQDLDRKVEVIPDFSNRKGFNTGN